MKPNRVLTNEQFTRLHAEGSYKWGMDWLRANMRLRDIANIYGLDTVKYKDMLTEMAEGVCKTLVGPGKQETHDLDPLVETDTYPALTIWEAIELLDGHAVLQVRAAQAICTAMHVPYDENLTMRWDGVGDAAVKYAIHGAKGNSGVDGRDLSNYLCIQLGISPIPGHRYSGRGFATDANKKAITQYFKDLIANQATQEEHGKYGVSNQD